MRILFPATMKFTKIRLKCFQVSISDFLFYSSANFDIFGDMFFAVIVSVKDRDRFFAVDFNIKHSSEQAMVNT